MSDSGRQIGDCKHGRTRQHCPECDPDAATRAHLDAVLTEVRRLRKALQPFADQAAIIDENAATGEVPPAEDYELFRFRHSYTAISYGDCKRAREALQ